MAEQIRLSSPAAPDNQGDVKEKWQDHAVCTQVDPELFFPEVGGSSEFAKKLCGQCDVILTCLKYQLDFENRPDVDGHFGIFGGMSERERRRLSKLMKENPLLTLEAARDAIISTRKRKGNPKFIKRLETEAA